MLSRILFQQQIDLPDILTKNLPTTIADLRLEQFDINQQRDELYQPNDYITKLEQQFEVKTGMSWQIAHYYPLRINLRY